MNLKAILASVAMVAIALPASSQIFWSSEYPKERPVEVGIHAGLNVAYMSDVDYDYWGNSYYNDDTTDPIAGFHAGIDLKIAITRTFYINTGCYASMKGGTWKAWGDDLKNAPQYKETVRPIYLDIPLLFTYRMIINDNNSIDLGLGPYFAIGVGGKWKEENRITGINDYDGDFFSSENHTRNFDCGVQFNIGWNYQYFYLGMGFQAGCVKVFKDYTYLADNGQWYQAGNSLYNTNFMITVGARLF
ncbi:MAG: PorT family protein [Bacteroidales bacterium]|nr:PorT family protein [Bacteroidales bacterium]